MKIIIQVQIILKKTQKQNNNRNKNRKMILKLEKWSGKQIK
jgi:hypothetical protein